MFVKKKSPPESPPLDTALSSLRAMAKPAPKPSTLRAAEATLREHREARTGAVERLQEAIYLDPNAPKKAEIIAARETELEAVDRMIHTARAHLVAERKKFSPIYRESIAPVSESAEGIILQALEQIEGAAEILKEMQEHAERNGGLATPRQMKSAREIQIATKAIRNALA